MKAYKKLAAEGGRALKFGGFRVGVDPETGALLLNPEPIECAEEEQESPTAVAEEEKAEVAVENDEENDQSGQKEGQEGEPAEGEQEAEEPAQVRNNFKRMNAIIFSFYEQLFWIFIGKSILLHQIS